MKAKPKSKPAKRKPGAGRKPIDPALKRVTKTYRLAPLTLRKIQRHQITGCIATEVGALEAMLAPYEPHQ